MTKQEYIKQFREGLDEVFEDDESYTGQNIDHTFVAVLEYANKFLSDLWDEAEKVGYANAMSVEWGEAELESKK